MINMRFADLQSPVCAMVVIVNESWHIHITQFLDLSGEPQDSYYLLVRYGTETEMYLPFLV